MIQHTPLMVQCLKLAAIGIASAIVTIYSKNYACRIMIAALVKRMEMSWKI